MATLGSNLSFQKNENLSRIIIDYSKQIDLSNDEIFLKYELYKTFFWSPEQFTPPVDSLVKFQKDFKDNEVITSGVYKESMKSVPISPTANFSSPFSVVTAPSTDYLGITLIAGGKIDLMSYKSHISISKDFADIILALPENLGSTYTDLINKPVTLFSRVNSTTFSNIFVISSVFSENRNSENLKIQLDSSYIIASPLSIFPGVFGINFSIKEFSVKNIQRLLSNIDAYLKTSPYYYNIDENYDYQLSASHVFDNSKFVIDSFNSTYLYFDKKTNVLVNLMIIVFMPLFLMNVYDMIRIFSREKRGVIGTFILIFCAFIFSTLIINIFTVFSFGSILIYLSNYYSFIFMVFLFISLIILHYTQSSKKNTRGKSIILGKPTIIQQVSNFEVSSGLTTDLRNMMNSTLLNDHFDFQIIHSTKKGKLSSFIDYFIQFSASTSSVALIRGAGVDSLAPTIAAKLTGKKVILAVHGLWSDLVYLGKVKSWTASHIIEPLIFSSADCYYTVYKNAIHKPILQNYKDKYIGTIYNPYRLIKHDDSDCHENQILKIKEVGDIIGLYIGRISREKGIEYLLDALNSLYSHGEYSKFKMFFIGMGPDIDQFKNWVQKKGLEGNIYFLGEKDNVSNYYKVSDIFLFPSLHENLPNSILEAVAHNLYIISTNVGGIPEILQKRSRNNMISPKRSDLLYNAIKNALDQKVYLNKEAHDNSGIEHTFSFEDFEDKIYNLFKNQF